MAAANHCNDDDVDGYDDCIDDGVSNFSDADVVADAVVVDDDGSHQ